MRANCWGRKAAPACGHVNGERGQALILMVFAMTVVFLLGVLMIDIGLWVSERREAQTAADMAALAGGVELTSLSGGGGVIAKAQQWATLNGYTQGVDGATVQVNYPYNGDSTKVEVNVSKPAPLLFSSIFSVAGLDVGARAVAGQRPGNPPHYNFVSLNTSTDNHTLLVKLGGQLTVTSGIYVDSSNSGDGFDIFGVGGNISSPDIRTHAGWETHDNDTVTVNGITCPLDEVKGPPWPVTPGCPSVNQPILADPFAGKIVAPTLGSAAGCSTSAFVTQPYAPAQTLTYHWSPDQKSAAITTTTTTTVTLSSAAPYLVQTGDTIKIENEQMIVTAVSGQTLTVTRHANGTTAATHGAGKVILHINTPASITITASGTAIQVGDTIVIDSEKMIVAGATGSNYTVLRGQDGTTAASHADGAPIQHIVSTGGSASTPQPCYLTSGGTYTLSPGTYYGGVCLGNAIGADCGGVTGTPACKSGTTPYSKGDKLELNYNPNQTLNLHYHDGTGAVKDQKNAAMTAAQTTLTLNNAAPFLVLTGETILIENEQMEVTGGSGSSFTVIRGANGTTAAAHGAGKTIFRVLGEDTTTIYVNGTLIQNGDIIQIEDEEMKVTAATVLGGFTKLTAQRGLNLPEPSIHADDGVQIFRGVTLTSTTIVSTQNDIQTGDIIQIDDERMKVTAKDSSGKILTVQRGYDGTSANTHLDGADIEHVTPTNTYVTLAAGTYIMAGGGFWVCGSLQLTAPHVLIYNTIDPTNSAGAGGLRNIFLNTNGTVSLGAQTSGPYAGLTIYQDPRYSCDATLGCDVKNNAVSCNSKSGDTSGASWDIALKSAGNGLNGISGTIYAPAQRAMFGDSVSGTANLAVITGCIYIDGASSTFAFDPGGLFGFTLALLE